MSEPLCYVFAYGTSVSPASRTVRVRETGCLNSLDARSVNDSLPTSPHLLRRHALRRAHMTAHGNECVLHAWYMALLIINIM